MVLRLRRLEDGSGKGGRAATAASSSGRATFAVEVVNVPDETVDEVYAEAQLRMEACKTQATRAKIARLKLVCRFGEDVELAFCMLEPKLLEEFVASEKDLSARLAKMPDSERSPFMLSLIGEVAPDIQSLVCRLQDVEGKA